MLLAIAAVATAWAAYQSARWHGEQAKAQSASIAARVESTRAANVANRQGQIDVALFTQWVDAYARDETELAAFYRKRFRPEFKPAFDAWVATRPRKNPERAAVAVRHAAVQARRDAKADRLEAKAAASSARRAPSSSGPTTTRWPSCCSRRRCSSRASARGCTSPTPRMVVLGLGYALFLGSVIWIATFPVSLSI